MGLLLVSCQEQKVRLQTPGHLTTERQFGKYERRPLPRASFCVSLRRSISRILSSAVIYLGPASPPASSSLPGSCPWGRKRVTPRPCGLPSCLALLPTGVAWPCRLPGAPVVSCTTFSPLPGLVTFGGLFLWPCPRVAPPGRYPALYPVESGLSSHSWITGHTRLPDQRKLCPKDTTFWPFVNAASTG